MVWGVLIRRIAMPEYPFPLPDNISDMVNRAANIIQDSPIKDLVNDTVTSVIEQTGLKDRVGDILSSQKAPNIDGAVTMPMSGEESCELLYPGDIIGIKRPLGYEHFAVYSGDGKVIHFAADGTDFGDPYIHEAPISEFLEGQQDFFVLDFSCAHIELDGDTQTLPYDDLPRIYPAEETLERARSVIGENEHGFCKRYDLVTNNCEHFAIWCKTGQIRSYQVGRFLDNLFGRQ